MAGWKVRFYTKDIDCITQVKVNEKTFSLYRWDDEFMSLPMSALSVLIMHYENILLDLEDESKLGKKYWSDGDIMIYTKIVSELIGPQGIETAKRKVLCILKVPIDVVMGAKKFQELVWKATVLNRIQRDHCSPCCAGYHLNSTKTIVFHDEGSFSIVNEDSPTYYQISLNGLIQLMMKRKEILADLDSQSSDEKTYYVDEIYSEDTGEDWMSEGFELKTMPSEDSRVFCFYLKGVTMDEFEEDIVDINEDHRLKKNTFELMLNVALGGPMWKHENDKIKEARMMYWDFGPFNVAKKIDFSADLQKFTISNDMYRVSLTMPTAALKAALDRKVQIISDLESEKCPPSREKDYINEYWTDQTYAIRTGVLYNLFREIDCKVVRFVKVKDDECVFAAHKEAFLKLLEAYQHRRRNSKKR